MKWIIIGIILGMVSLLLLLIIYIKHNLKTLRENKKIKLIGLKAEKIINADLKKWCKMNNAYFINTGLYKYNTNKVFEVDSVIITTKCLIVVEIKSIKGNIVGNANDDQWVKQLKNSSFKISSPLKQNDRHIKHIMNIIKEKIPIVSLIIFSDSTNNLEIVNIPDYALVIRRPEIVETLDEIQLTLKESLIKKDLIKIRNNLKRFKTKSIKAKNFHKKITRNTI